jgi:hypothetical protein
LIRCPVRSWRRSGYQRRREFSPVLRALTAAEEETAEDVAPCYPGNVTVDLNHPKSLVVSVEVGAGKPATTSGRPPRLFN